MMIRYFRHAGQTSGTMALLLVLLAFSFHLRAQQQEFTFNAPGSACYFDYICYAPDNDYVSFNRPCLFILGNTGQPAGTACNEDTLKNMPQFFNYMFIYVPNRGNDAGHKLGCLNVLASLLTDNFRHGHANLFLYVKDPDITMADVNALELNSVFKSVRLYEPSATGTSPDAIPTITEAFKATAIVYQPEPKQKDEEDGIYYVEEEEDTTTVAESVEMPVKTYFGPPAAFKFTQTGIVKDKITGEALPFAAVVLRGSNTGTSTNADGWFTLVKVPTDTSVLVVQYVGYNTTEVYLTPLSPKKNLSIELRPLARNLKTVTITGKKDDVVLVNQADANTVKMTPRKLEQLPNFGEKDIMRSFQLMPGVSASNESSSGLYVRGGTPDQNLVVYDGFTIYHVDHLYGFFSAFNANALKDVQLYKGGFESRFGGRLSSVTEITGKDGNQNRFNLGADLSLLSVNFFAEIPAGKKFTSVIAFRRSYKGLLYNSIFKKFNNSGTTQSVPESSGPGGRQSQNTEVTSYFYDLNGKFTYRPNDKDILSLSLFNGIDKLDNSGSMNAPSFGTSGGGFGMSSTDLTKYGNTGGSLKWSRKWSQKLYGNTILSYSNYFSDRDRSQERTAENSGGESVTTRNGVMENNDLKDYSLKSDYQWDLFRATRLQFGGFGTYFDIGYTYAQSDTATVLERKNLSTLAGGYLQSKTRLFSEKLQLLPGIRVSYFATTGKTYTEPRFSVTCNLTDKIILKAATGKYYQFANRVTREDLMSGSKDFWLLSDGKKIPVSSSLHYMAGISYESNDYLFSAEAYYKRIASLTEYSLRFNPSPMGTSYDENFFTGKGTARGIEFLAQKKAGRFNGWVSYTLGEARNYFSVYSDEWYPANQDVTHEFKIVTQYKYRRWDFAATWVYATGRSYTAPSGAYSITLLDGSTQDFFTVTAKNGLRLPDYHRLDLSASYRLLMGTKEDKKRREIGTLGLSLFNVYDRRNVWYKQFTIQDGAILETNVRYLGLTPNLTLSLKLR